MASYSLHKSLWIFFHSFPHDFFYQGPPSSSTISGSRDIIQIFLLVLLLHSTLSYMEIFMIVTQTLKLKDWVKTKVNIVQIEHHLFFLKWEIWFNSSSILYFISIIVMWSTWITALLWWVRVSTFTETFISIWFLTH